MWTWQHWRNVALSVQLDTLMIIILTYLAHRGKAVLLFNWTAPLLEESTNTCNNLCVKCAAGQLLSWVFAWKPTEDFFFLLNSVCFAIFIKQPFEIHSEWVLSRRRNLALVSTLLQLEVPLLSFPLHPPPPKNKRPRWQSMSYNNSAALPSTD